MRNFPDARRSFCADLPSHSASSLAAYTLLWVGSWNPWCNAARNSIPAAIFFRANHEALMQR